MKINDIEVSIKTKEKFLAQHQTQFKSFDSVSLQKAFHMTPTLLHTVQI